MKTFKIYKHPTQGFEAVKVGFSWPAFFFDMIWMLVKKLWGFAAIWFCIYVVYVIVDSVIQGPFGILVLLVATLAIWLIPGFKGNEWRESNLSARGYEHIETVEAGNPDAAVAKATNPGSSHGKEHQIQPTIINRQPLHVKSKNWHIILSTLCNVCYMALKMFAYLLLGLIAGYFIDKLLGTEPWFLLFSLVLGFVLGLKNIIQN